MPTPGQPFRRIPLFSAFRAEVISFIEFSVSAFFMYFEATLSSGRLHDYAFFRLPSSTTPETSPFTIILSMLPQCCAKSGNRQPLQTRRKAPCRKRRRHKHARRTAAPAGRQRWRRRRAICCVDCCSRRTNMRFFGVEAKVSRVCTVAAGVRGASAAEA